MSTKLVTLNLCRVGRVQSQGTNAIRDNWIPLSKDTILRFEEASNVR